MQLDHHLARMAGDHDLFHGIDPDTGTEFLITKWHADGTYTVAVRELGQRTWGAPVPLRPVA